MNDFGIWGLLLVWLIVWGIYFIFWGEQEGYLNDMSSCKEIIKTEDQFYNRLFTKYTCIYNRSSPENKLIWGTCYHPVINSNGICTKLYMYDKKTEIVCPDPINWYLDYSNGKCYCKTWKDWNDNTNKCE